jgi:hypothetical protein
MADSFLKKEFRSRCRYGEVSVKSVEQEGELRKNHCKPLILVFSLV